MKSFSKEELWSLIRDVHDFPKRGVTFKDFSPLFEVGALGSLVEHLEKEAQGMEFDGIACVESRGFLLAAPLAAKLAKPMYLVRKKGKLPPPTHQVSYELEYGSDTLEMRSTKGKILLVDDVLATGGTLRASAELVEKGGGTVAGFVVAIDLKFLNKFSWKGMEPRALFSIE